jgi:hypothetical protein
MYRKELLVKYSLPEIQLGRTSLNFAYLFSEPVKLMIEYYLNLV